MHFDDSWNSSNLDFSENRSVQICANWPISYIDLSSNSPTFLHTQLQPFARAKPGPRAHWFHQIQRRIQKLLPPRRRVWLWVWIPSGYVKIAIENGHRNSGFTHWKWWFPILMLVYQRVNICRIHLALEMFGLTQNPLQTIMFFPKNGPNKWGYTEIIWDIHRYTPFSDTPIYRNLLQLQFFDPGYPTSVQAVALVMKIAAKSLQSCKDLKGYRI